MFKNLVIRAVSGAVFVALVISSILVDSPIYFGVLFLLVALLGLHEFYALAGKMSQVSLSLVLPMGAGVSFFVASCLSASRIYTVRDWSLLFWLLAILAVFSIFVLELFRKQENPIKNIAVSLMGQIYVVLPICAMVLLKALSPILLLAFFIIIWASDTGAYLSGMCFGRHKMFERVSPKKTWEGFCGGFLSAMLMAYIFGRYATGCVGVRHFPFWWWFVFAAIVFVLGTLGDLIESLFKRTLNVKDSGSIMPGHGGILDRVDSALLAAPIATIFAVCSAIYLME